MKVRGIRGATTADLNTKEAILTATQELLEAIVQTNNIRITDLAGVFFTATKDLDAVYPAEAARTLGWNQTPLLCYQEMEVGGSLRRCIRVMLLFNTETPPDQLKHIYLKKASRLRPDLIQ